MTLELFAGLAVSDIDAARAWYARLLGTGPSFEPHEREAVWTLAEARHVYVEERPDRAGSGQVTLFVDDLDAWVDAVTARGVEPATRETYGNGVRKVTYRDPDGNEVGIGGAAEDA